MIEVKISADNKYYLLVKGANGEDLSQTETLESTQAVLTNAYAQDISLYERVIKIGDFTVSIENTDDESLRAKMRELLKEHMAKPMDLIDLGYEPNNANDAVKYAQFVGSGKTEPKLASAILKSKIIEHTGPITIIIIHPEFYDMVDAEKEVYRSANRYYYFYGHKLIVSSTIGYDEILIY